MRGVVTQFFDEQGYGFIRAEGTSQSVFVHVQDVPGFSPLRVGQAVVFETTQTAKGPRALNVVPGRRQVGPKLGHSLVGLGIVALFTVALALAAGVPWILSWLVGVNLVVFVLYGWDKRSARRSRFRTPEITLQGLALLGGTPAAFVAQRLFHHKTRKQSFQLVFWTIVALQVCLFIWYLALR